MVSICFVWNGFNSSKQVAFSTGRPNGSGPSGRYSDGLRTALRTGCFLGLWKVRSQKRSNCAFASERLRTRFGRPLRTGCFLIFCKARSQERSIEAKASGRSPGVRPDGLDCFALSCLPSLYICIFLKGILTYVFRRLGSDFWAIFGACSPRKQRSKPCFEIVQRKIQKILSDLWEEAWAERLAFSTDCAEDRCSTKSKIVRRIEECRRASKVKVYLKTRSGAWAVESRVDCKQTWS